METAFECVPAPTFGAPGEAQCVNLLPDLRSAGDGLVPSAATALAHPELFGDKLQVRLELHPAAAAAAPLCLRAGRQGMADARSMHDARLRTTPWLHGAICMHAQGCCNAGVCMVHMHLSMAARQLQRNACTHA